MARKIYGLLTISIFQPKFSKIIKSQPFSSLFMINIRNPTHDEIFKELFGPYGTPVNDVTSKDRLISLLNQIYGPGFVTDIEYRDTCSDKMYSITFEYDVRFFCKEVKIHFDLEMQRKPKSNEDYYGRAELYGSRILQDNTEKGDGYANIPTVRVLSILGFNIDDTLDPIFHAQQMETSSHKPLSEHLLYTYVQLPLIHKHGTNSQWLQLLAEGAGQKKVMTINKEQYSGDKILESSIILLKACLKPSALHALQQANYSYGKNQKLAKDSIDQIFSSNKRMIHTILKLKIQGNDSDEVIATSLGLDLNTVHLVIAIAELTQSYNNFCQEKGKEPNENEFMEEAKNHFGVPDNYIETVYKYQQSLNQTDN